ncbi:MAG: SpoIID/LytB domain-containing protein [Lachnospiraceae bacterium]|nr:SpoIID/LytB domain-containing protein [Lachnospiraceae bacterium]
MDKKIKVIQLKILLVILEIFLILLIWTLLQLLFKPKQEAEHFKAGPKMKVQETFKEQQVEIQKEPEATVIPTPAPTPFVLTNFDKIRVIITNKEKGGIYHESIENWKERTDYRGTFEFVEEKEGFVIINELPIEEYLYSVVPSEMPASYPLEALKAQAICARTYAYLHILSPGYPKYSAHVDDTTAYQVYHSVAEQVATNQAVNETSGKILMEPSGLAPAQTYYYSTSCGYGSDAHVWRTKYSDNYPYIKSQPISSDSTLPQVLTEEEFEIFIQDVRAVDYEAEECWYRWSYEVKKLNAEHIYQVLKKRYEANPELILTENEDDYVSQPINEFKKVLDIQVLKRGPGGVADELLIITDKKTYKVITELNIRYILNDGCSKVKRQDGKVAEMNQLLPSAFITLELTKKKDVVSGYIILGGGYGHGAGMSQNAAKAMAKEGMTAEEILTFFYRDCFVKEKEGSQENMDE